MVQDCALSADLADRLEYDHTPLLLTPAPSWPPVDCSEQLGRAIQVLARRSLEVHRENGQSRDLISITSMLLILGGPPSPRRRGGGLCRSRPRGDHGTRPRESSSSGRRISAAGDSWRPITRLGTRTGS